MGGMNMTGYGGIGGLLVLGLDIWAVVSVLGSSSSSGGKALWILLIVLLPLLGFIIWLIAGPKAVSSGI